jgi:hypothetical protein
LGPGAWGLELLAAVRRGRRGSTQYAVRRALRPPPPPPAPRPPPPRRAVLSLSSPCAVVLKSTNGRQNKNTTHHTQAGLHVYCELALKRAGTRNTHGRGGGPVRGAARAKAVTLRGSWRWRGRGRGCVWCDGGGDGLAARLCALRGASCWIPVHFARCSHWKY